MYICMQTTDYKKFLTRFTCSCQQKYFSGKCEKLVASKKELKAFMQIDQGNYGTMRFMSKQVCQKLAQSCKNWKSVQKLIYALFARRPSIGLIGNLSSCNAQFCCGVMKQVMQLVLLIRYGHQRGTAYQLFVLK